MAQEAVQAAETLRSAIDELKAGQGSELEQARTEAQETQHAAEALREAHAADLATAQEAARKAEDAADALRQAERGPEGEGALVAAQASVARRVGVPPAPLRFHTVRAGV